MILHLIISGRAVAVEVDEARYRAEQFSIQLTAIATAVK